MSGMRRPLVLALLLVPLAVYAVVVGAFWVFQRDLLYPGATGARASPRFAPPAGTEPIRIRTSARGGASRSAAGLAGRVAGRSAGRRLMAGGTRPALAP